jgi:hypothetical protein
MIIVGFFTSSAAFSSFMGNAVISNTGKISLFEITAKSGSPVDIQAAVNSMQAAGGGIVHVPAGTYNWNNETVHIPGGVNIIGAGAGCSGHPDFTESIAETILRNSQWSTMFVVDGSNGKTTRISGIRFEFAESVNASSEAGVAIWLDGCMDYRVDHCTIINAGQIAIFADDTHYGKCRGVIDHCVVDNPYKDTIGGIWAYGFYVRGLTQYYWDDATKFFGKYETVPTGFCVMYIEDCHLSRCRHSFDAIQGGWYVARYNLIDNPRPTNYGMINIHGTSGWTSGRGFEAYNNTIVGASGHYGNSAIWQRGGCSIVFNNTFTNDFNSQYNIFIALSNDDTANQLPNTHVNNTYIWNNQIAGGTLFENTGGYVENVNYFLRAPSLTQDGFTYTPYVYPHPLVSATP